MLGRLIAVFGSLVLVASCYQAPPPPAPPVVSAPPSVLDPRKATYELQEKCAHDAYELYKHEWLEKPQGKLRTIDMNYTNHYNARLGRCFIDVMFTYATAEKGKVVTYRSRSLIDVLENREVGSALIPMQRSGEVYFCYVADKQCAGTSPLTAIHTWEGYAKPYMED